MGKARWSEVFYLVWSCLIMLRSLGSSFMRRGFAWNMSHRCSDAPDQYKMHFSINTKQLEDSRAISCFWGGAWHWGYLPWLRTELQSNAGLLAGSVRKGCICLVCLFVNDPIPAYTVQLFYTAKQCFGWRVSERTWKNDMVALQIIKHLFLLFNYWCSFRDEFLQGMLAKGKTGWHPLLVAFFCHVTGVSLSDS